MVLSATLLAVSFIISVINFFTAPKFTTDNSTTSIPKVSVLIPTRNEASNIGNLLADLSAQEGVDFQVLMLDDGSTDDTAAIVQNIADKNPRIRLITGSQLPQGWRGKTWACWQLSQQADTEYMIFIDADVRLHPDTLRMSMGSALTQKIDLLSISPAQKAATLGEKLAVPLLNWLTISFLPLTLVPKLSYTSLSAVNGQFIVFRKEAYEKIGGYSAVKNEIVEDMALGRLVKKAGYKVALYQNSGLVSCRMYTEFSQVMSGFGKNFAQLFGSLPAFLLLTLIINIAYFLPLILIAYSPISAAMVALILVQRFIQSRLSDENTLENMLLHFPQMIMFDVITANSILFGLGLRKISWKGRQL